MFLARVVNHSHICFEEEHLKAFHNFPWLAGVDIFQLDYLYDEEEKEKKRSQEILYLIAIAEGITDESVNPKNLRRELRQIELQYHISLPTLQNRRKAAVRLYQLAEQLMQKAPEKESTRVGQIFPWVLKGGKGYPRRYFEKIIRLPFENTTIPVPAYYNELLTRHYADYFEVHKVWNMHEYPFFEKQRADLETLNQGSILSGFHIHAAMLLREPEDLNGYLKEKAGEYLQRIGLEQSHAIEDILSGNKEAFMKKLASCQEFAITLGTYIEKHRGEARESTKRIVNVLERYCECLYQSTRNIEEGKLRENLQKLEEVYKEAETCIRDDIIEKKEILFLPIGPREWRGMQDLYEAINRAEDAEIYIVPLPLMEKDPFGRVMTSETEMDVDIQVEEYPELKDLVDWKDYDLSVHRPDTIYFQNPYDNENPVLTVPPDFYAKNLRNYTKELVFIPFAKTNEFGKDDWPDQYNLKYYVTAPGIFYADKVYVQSENIKEQYVNKLVSFAGQGMEKYWRRKIQINPFTNKRTEKHKKALLYCIGLNELNVQGDIFINAVKKRIRAFLKAESRIKTELFLYPSNREEWKKVNSNLSEELFSLFETEAAEDHFLKVNDREESMPEMADRVADEFTAYYGSPSPFVLAFVNRKKPVMIADYNEE